MDKSISIHSLKIQTNISNIQIICQDSSDKLNVCLEQPQGVQDPAISEPKLEMILKLNTEISFISQ